MVKIDTKIKSWLKVILKIVITTALIYYIFQTIDFNDIKALYLKSNIFFLFLAFLSYLFSQIFSSWRLLTFLKDVKIDVSFGFNFRLYLLGLFYNVFLPGGIGGDGYKIYLLRKKFKQPAKDIFMALLFDRLSGLWAVSFLSLLLNLFIPKINIPAIWLVSLFLVGTLVYYLVMRFFFKKFSDKFILKLIKAGIVQSFMLVCVICILLSQGFDGKFSPYLFSFLLSSIVGLINIGIGGLGVRDVFMAHAADFFDIKQDLNLYISFTFWFISTGLALLGLWPIYKSKEFEPLPSEDEVKLTEEKAANSDT